MSVTYGFYNSHDGDRVYDAEQFSSFLDGIVYDGIYEAVGNKFYVIADGSSLQLIVDTGRAWFNHTWTVNDTYLYLDAPEADPQLDRIDAVIIEVNKEIRENRIRIIEGSPSENPVRPSMTKTDMVSQYALAYIERPAASSVILQDNITYVVGESETPLCSALALAGIPSGGKIGQVLAKSYSASGAVGWYDIDKLPFEVWYLAEGISENQVLAAYKFVNRPSEMFALKNINEHNNYVLTKTDDGVTWNSQNGISIPSGSTMTSPHGLLNSELRGLGRTIKTVIIKYSDATSKAVILSGGWGGWSDNARGSAIYARTPYGTQSYSYNVSAYPGYTINRGHNKTARADSSYPNAIISASFDYDSNTVKFYINGQLTNMTVFSDMTMEPQPDIGSIVGMKKKSHDYNGAASPNNWSYGGFKVQYIAFYNMLLTDAQHAELYANITSDIALENS